jgi:hypothetical protein
MAETNKILNHNPLGDTDEILRKEYYGSSHARRAEDEGPAPKPKKAKKAKPTHYKVVCISLYTRDIENLEAKVAELKRRGHTKANKSQLIRYALNQLDLDAYPEPQP